MPTKRKNPALDVHLRKSVSPDKRKRQGAVIDLVKQEVGVEDIVDLIIAGGFHKPAAPLDPADPAAAERFRKSVRRLVYYDLQEIVEAMAPEEAAKKPLYRAIYEQQQSEMYSSARKVWDSETNPKKRSIGQRQGLNPMIIARAADLMMEASKNLAIIRGLDVAAKQKHEIDVGERLAKAARSQVGGYWKKYRELHPVMPNKESERAMINITPRATPDDDAGDFN